MKENEASIIALQALAFIAEDHEVASKFLAEAGMDTQDIKDRMHEPEVQGGVLDLVLSDDRLILGFCNAHDYTPENIIEARKALPGGLQLMD